MTSLIAKSPKILDSFGILYASEISLEEIPKLGLHFSKDSISGCGDDPISKPLNPIFSSFCVCCPAHPLNAGSKKIK